MRYITRILVLFSFIYLVSCQEVIDIDLNSSNPVLVVDGEITVGNKAHVQLSYSSDYFTSETPAMIENAQVTLFSSNGEMEVLKHVANGFYQGYKMQGDANTVYEITIEVEDEMYAGKSSILSDFDWIKLDLVETSFTHPRMQVAGEDSIRYNIRFTFTDNPEQRNFYIVEVYQQNETLEYQYLLIDDQFYEKTGAITYLPLMYQFETGAEVNLKISSVDRATYDFYNQLSDLTGGGPPMARMGTPYNPLSNMGSDVMGYFMAGSVIDTTFVVQ